MLTIDIKILFTVVFTAYLLFYFITAIAIASYWEGRVPFDRWYMY